MAQHDYTSKVTYHFVEDSQSVKQIQLFNNIEDAEKWAKIQEVRGFTPVSVDNNTDIDTDMYHVGDKSPQVHQGHYAQPTKTHHA